MSAAKQNIVLVIFFQIVLTVLFVIFSDYAKIYHGKSYAMFQDVHVMIFIGFGYLMTFLKKYGYSAVSFNFLLGSLMVQWAMLCQGFYQMNENNKIEIGIESLFKADIAAAAVLISMGALLGRTTYIQLLIMGIVEIAVFSANAVLGVRLFQVADAGGSIFVHAFGAYFGLAVSFALEFKNEKPEEQSSLEGASYTSDIFAMIGTIFLWLFWPSFNAIELEGIQQEKAIVNTYLSLAACCVVTFAISQLLTENHKFDMVHIQNSTLAGGVAVGASANLMLEPWGAILVGIISGVISVVGYVKITPWLQSNFGIRDTCGVHNLHGIPGVLAGLIGALMAGIATESTYSQSLYDIYPARQTRNETTSGAFVSLPGRSAGVQAGYQILALVVTVLIAIITGFITGYLLRIKKTGLVKAEDRYDDTIYWLMPEGNELTKEEAACTTQFASYRSNEIPEDVTK